MKLRYWVFDKMERMETFRKPGDSKPHTLLLTHVHFKSKYDSRMHSYRNERTDLCLVANPNSVNEPAP